ncbi:MAG: ribose-5-phosphate isomerase RpiA [Pseudomonadota bacterium]|nr:ribose-5-phosphate isomerase RpiA [Pseudomonadota bacterium]
MNKKQHVASEVIQEISQDLVIGLGTGSTVDCLIDQLHEIECPDYFVSSSIRTTNKLISYGYAVKSFNEVGPLDLYIDGADQVLKTGVALKGGGGCHTIEKLLATHAKRFVGIVSDDKLVSLLSAPIAVEVLEPARSSVARAIIGMGGNPVYREGFKTDSGHIIIDVSGLVLTDPASVEAQLQQLVGVVEVGIFAQRRFDLIYVSNGQAIEKY